MAGAGKLAALIERAQDIADHADTDADIAHVIKDLIAQAEGGQKRLDRLVKRSDATEAKLFDANKSLETITENLSRFVPETVARKLMNDGHEQLASIKRCNLTVFFSDIIGFSTIATRQEPEVLAHLMMEYFTEMTEICRQYGGTLDQFIGDAIVIFFGDPESKGVKEDAISAVNMAMDMQAKLTALRAKWLAEGITEAIHVRMGISTGYCYVGNFGSKERLHYTAIGNAVNEAARIEGKASGDTVVMSQDTQKLVADVIKTTSLGHENLKGRDHLVELFRAEGRREERDLLMTVLSGEGYHVIIDHEKLDDRNGRLADALEQALKKIKGPSS